MFKIVLVATDMSEACDAAVSTALEIVKQNNGRLQVLHVLESASAVNRNVIKHFNTGEEIACTDEYKEAVKKELDKKIAEACQTQFNWEIRVTTGFPWEQILKWAKEARVDLIVMGPHADRAKENGVLRTGGTIGSTIEGVIMRERCPVMVVNRPMSKERLKFKRVMVSTDFSKSCTYALRFAIKLAQKHGSKIYLFHMLPVPPSSRYSQADYEADLHSLGKRLEALSEEIPCGIDGEYKVWGGALPHLEIEKYAAKKDIDLLVMGSHTKEKEGKWYVGSAVERVSLRSICPVMVITDPQALLSAE
jgi:nucleotide-binding universal stress UspA family protein